MVAILRTCHCRARTLLLCVLALAGAAQEASAEPATRQPIRGVWVANASSGPLSSAQRSREFVDLCHQCGVNTLFVVVWNRGTTVYPSAVMQREFGISCDERYRGRDALREIIDAAHAKNIRVMAWFEFGFSCSYGKPDGDHIIRRKPHWAARDLRGKLVSKNGFQWMNAFHPEVQDFILSLLKEVAENYEVDGVQGDDRLPANPNTAGYDDWTVDLYAQEHKGRHPPENCLDADWITWRANLLNRFAERMHRELKATNPNLVIATAPSIFPWSKYEYLQDWPTWVENGWVDIVSPQVYRDNIGKYRSELSKIVAEQIPAEKLDRVFPGILVQTADGYRTTDTMVEEMIAENRRRGLHGEVVFYDAGLVQHQKVFTKLYRPESEQR